MEEFNVQIGKMEGEQNFLDSLLLVLSLRWCDVERREQWRVTFGVVALIRCSPDFARICFLPSSVCLDVLVL
ncbi:uncharacterized protein G2W53_041847 [Senna tora]|uniref:Uncharacterized protein n=1 Tax=Senna tora TaxID=362788 RepID=A0A834SGD2_9FABA|nr:uncharacterized protein G2W53_041847 [Senna tora]